MKQVHVHEAKTRSLRSRLSVGGADPGRVSGGDLRVRVGGVRLAVGLAVAVLVGLAEPGLGIGLVTLVMLESK